MDEADTAPTARKILTLFGTRPELIKLAPVMAELRRRRGDFTTVNVSSSQHTDLLAPLITLLDVPVHHDLKVMLPNQTLSTLMARVLSAIDPILLSEKPDAVLVQGDTTTALAGALAAFHRHIPVGHVEAGLRSGDRQSPFPEEMNRRLITQVGTFHFAATVANRDNLLAEGIDPASIFLTGNTVVDSLLAMKDRAKPDAQLQRLLDQTAGKRRILLTTHRRESFGQKMADNLTVLRRFIQSQPDIHLFFPVHPNPAVSGPARELLGGCPRIHLIPPLDYQQFVALMAQAWLIVSDSGGVQEEAPSLGKPLLILRENTERPEAVEAGCAVLAGDPELLEDLLEDALSPQSWIHSVSARTNPFGDGHAARRIADALQPALPTPISIETGGKAVGK